MTSLAALVALASAHGLPQAAPAAPASSEPVELLRKWKAGETLKYKIRSLLVTEVKRLGAPYFQPNDMEINYDSSLEVKSIKSDGFAEMIYRRPTMDIVEGESAEGDRQVHKEKTNLVVSLTVSPINEITNLKDLSKPADKPKALMLTGAALGQNVGGLPFIQELYRLALFVGSLDTALDLAPKLPFEEVKVGDTWKRTASYQPQALKGGKGKMAVQRLDWTYRYDGQVTVEGKKCQRITGSLSLDTDAGAFINQAMGMTAGESGLEKLPLKLDSTVSFDLDPVTLDTIRAQAATKGSWSVKVSQIAGNILEEKITGKTSLTLAR